MAKRKIRSVSTRPGKPPLKSESSKRQKAEVDHSNSESSIPEPSLKAEFLTTEGSSKSKAKPMLKERMVDMDLLQRIGIVRLFETLRCAPLLSPSTVHYPF